MSEDTKTIENKSKGNKESVIERKRDVKKKVKKAKKERRASGNSALSL